MTEETFTCRRCGYCCHGETTVSLDAGDQRRMLEVLGITRDEALRRYWVVRGSQVQMKTVDGHCIFYVDGCSVHPGRPWRCRQWPLVDAILRDPVNLASIRHSCRGFHPAATYEEVCAAIRQSPFSSDGSQSPQREK